MVLTDASFARVDRVVAGLFGELGLRGEATLQTDAQGTTLSISVDLASLDQPGPELASPASALLEDLDRYRFILTDGKFVRRQVSISLRMEYNRERCMEIPEETVKAGGVLKLKLEWRVVR